MTGENPEKNNAMHCGVIAVIGAPNAGKSTLVNALVGTKVAIVSHKVQTTRTRLMGIAMDGQTQLVLVDTPGIFAPKRRLDRAMVQTAWGEIGDADQIVLMIDAKRGVSEDVERILEGLNSIKVPVILILNKVDALKDKTKLLRLVEELNARHKFAETFMLSALNGSGVADLKSYLTAHMPEGPWLFPEDQVSDVTARIMAAEITREQVFLQLHDELPYAITVETEKWEERKDGSVRIEQVIFVERDTQKRIVIGKGGSRLKSIGEKARLAMEELLGHRVHLFLFAKTDPRWSDSRERYENIGLDWID